MILQYSYINGKPGLLIKDLDFCYKEGRVTRFNNRLVKLILAAWLFTACTPLPTAVPSTSTSAPVTPSTPPASSSATPNPYLTDGETPVPTSQPATSETPIRVTIGDTVLTGRLWDNTTAHDLIAQLPLTLSFRDFNGVEKIAQLPRRLSMDGVPAGDDPFPRDIGYYNPSGDLVFYYDDVGYFTGIVRIGQFDGDMDVIASQTGDFTATIELAK
jgi:hypothetical protein